MKNLLLVFSIFVIPNTFATNIPEGQCHYYSNRILKTENDKECQLYLAWGHSHDGHYFLENNELNGIAMGCNSGKAGIGFLQNASQYWRFQRGSNGTYSNQDAQGTQNGGLNPVIFDKNDIESLSAYSKGIVDKNSYMGFMRMTQYHWLQLHNFARRKLIGKTCKRVKIQFTCRESDMQNNELRKRLYAFGTKTESKLFSTFDGEYEKEIEIMNRVEPLRGCFTRTQKFDALPLKCESSVIVDNLYSGIAPHCQKWVKLIQALPQQNWETPSSLPRPEDYAFTADDRPIH